MEPGPFIGNGNGVDSHLGISHDGEIPEVVIRRLPIYARTLDELIEHGIRTISSNDLADRIGVTAAQIRRDLSYFGRFGKQGRGYDIAFLVSEIRRILNLTRDWHVALVGFGHLGQAIARYRGFRESNFRIAATPLLLTPACRGRARPVISGDSTTPRRARRKKPTTIPSPAP